jgi:hypothetical protein
LFLRASFRILAWHALIFQNFQQFLKRINLCWTSLGTRVTNCQWSSSRTNLKDPFYNGLLMKSCLQTVTLIMANHIIWDFNASCRSRSKRDLEMRVGRV